MNRQSVEHNLLNEYALNADKVYLLAVFLMSLLNSLILRQEIPSLVSYLSVVEDKHSISLYA